MTATVALAAFRFCINSIYEQEKLLRWLGTTRAALPVRDPWCLPPACPRGSDDKDHNPQGSHKALCGRQCNFQAAHVRKGPLR